VNFLKRNLIYIALVCCVQLNGQQIAHKDTVEIAEVLISVRPRNNSLAFYNSSTIDPSLFSINSHMMLGEILSENTSIYIKSYGPGGVATPSFRGTGSGHTTIAWNGININNSMLGQSDLSLIPAGFADDIRINYGAASISQASGGIGGSINLENTVNWNHDLTVSLSAGAGSFGHYTGEGKISAGTTNFQSVTRLFYNIAENDFPYLNSVSGTEPVWDLRENNQVRQKGFEQELYYRHAANTLTGRIWYQSADRNLPGSILVQPHNSGEKQFDESLRTMLEFTGDRGTVNYFVKGAWVYDRLDYINQIASIDSKNISESGVIRAGAGLNAGKKTRLDFLLDEEMNIVRSNNYETKESRNTTTITASANSSFIRKLNLSFLLRQIITKNQLLIPDFSGALKYRIFEGKDYFLKANISRNSKIPTMNDLFWMPGGNPDLKNEYAYMYELFFEMAHKFESDVKVDYDFAIFSNRIKDMIQWLPGEYSYWSPSNIRMVNTGGIETSARVSFSSEKLSSSLRISYTYTNAENVSESGSDLLSGKQLIYIPENQANAFLFLKYGSIYSSWRTGFEGKRYTSVDNSKFLPSYLLSNLTAGSVLSVGEITLDLSLSINNIFNSEYQSVAYYPMPGRSFFLKLKFNLIKF
jgi:hypothetical protein